MSDNRIPLPLTGGCQCGARRYAVTRAPLTLYCCHCSECQAQASSAFGMSMLVERDALETDWSALATWTRSAASGNTLDCHFCPDCGARLFHVGRGDDAIVSVKAGSLDNRAVLRPIGHIWTASAQPWFRVPDDAVTTAGDPGDMEPFFRRWREATEGWFE